MTKKFCVLITSMALLSIGGAEEPTILKGYGKTPWGQPLAEVQEILPGDTVVIPPNTRHWHGAAPDQMMCHLALSESDDAGAATDCCGGTSSKFVTCTPPFAHDVKALKLRAICSARAAVR